MSEEHNPKLAYTEACEVWERLGVPDEERPDYVEWLEQQYTSHLHSIETWRAAWRRKTTLLNEYRRDLSVTGLSHTQIGRRR